MSSTDQHEFWMVWNPERHAPTHRHDAHDEAMREAERLARLNRGSQFFVLRATDCVFVTDVVRVELVPRDEIPF